MKETWEQFCKRVEEVTADMLEEEYKNWIVNNPKEYQQLIREEELRLKIK